MTDEYGNYGQGTQKTYTLTVGDKTIDLSQKNLGPVDVTLVTVWMQRPEVSAALASLILDRNPIFGRFGHQNLFT
eukprot:COSAG01_NODE_10354_length_2186_cov_1.979396_1_plen_74_part_10